MRAARALLLLAIAVGGAEVGDPEPALAAEPLSVQVNRAVERGIERLRTWQQGDGTFTREYDGNQEDGAQALGTYALLRCGLGKGDRTVARALGRVEDRPIEKVYGAALRILVLDALSDPARDAEIRALGLVIERSADPEDRLWSYVAGDKRTDLANTAFAVLGLRVAEKHGFRAKDTLWGDLVARLPDLQGPDGGFFYSLNRNPRVSTGSLTVEGILTLELALEHRVGDPGAIRRARECLGRAWAYLGKRFTGPLNFQGVYAFQHDWQHYYLWGLERLAALTGKGEIGGRDWYREGARLLLSSQSGDGSWGKYEDTCFALLFLTRSTAPLAGKAQPRWPEGEGVEVPREDAPIAPRREVAFVRRWLLLGPFPDPGDTVLEEAPFREADARPRAGTVTAERKWIEHRSLTDWVDLKRAVGAEDRTVTWAFLWLHVAEEQDAVLWFGHDDAAHVLVDGVRVHDWHFHEARGLDGFHATVHLAKGVHRLLFAVEENWGGTGLGLRITRPDGFAARGVIPSLSDIRPELEEGALAEPGRFTLAELLRLMPVDSRGVQEFEVESSLLGVAVSGLDPGAFWPHWWHGPRGPDERGPPGPFQGAVGVHPDPSGRVPARLYRRVRIPQGRSGLRVRVAGEAGESKGAADVAVRIGIYAGDLSWLLEEVVGGEGRGGWRTLEADLSPWAGRDALIVAEVAYGGRTEAWEEAWFDEISVLNR